MYSLPSVKMLPHEACGACTPRPKKLKPDSTSTALAMPNIELTMMGVKLLGNKCVKMSRASLAPNACAANTNSRLRKLKNSARTNLVTHIHDVKPMTIIIFQIEGVKNAMTAKIKKKVGIESITSTIRMMTVSTQPR